MAAVTICIGIITVGLKLLMMLVGATTGGGVCWVIFGMFGFGCGHNGGNAGIIVRV